MREKSPPYKSNGDEQTFFSTDVVKYQNGGEDGNNPSGTSYSKLALERWFEVTAPLTLLTFIIAVGWYYYWDVLKDRFLAWWRGEEPQSGDPEKAMLGS